MSMAFLWREMDLNEVISSDLEEFDNAHCCFQLVRRTGSLQYDTLERFLDPLAFENVVELRIGPLAVSWFSSGKEGYFLSNPSLRLLQYTVLPRIHNHTEYSISYWLTYSASLWIMDFPCMNIS